MQDSAAVLAVRVLACLEAEASGSLIVVVDGEQKAEALARLLGQLDPERATHRFPAWDCLPFDRAAPSPDIMGHRMRVLHEAARAPARAVLVTTPEAIVQRVPPRAVVPGPLRFQAGAGFDPDAVTGALARFGYVHADIVEEPGQMTLRGEVLDIYPPLRRPVRLTLADGVIGSIHSYDPVTQRSVKDIPHVRIDPISEIVEPRDAPVERFVGMEHWLPTFYPALESVLDMLPDAGVMIEPEAQARLDELFGQIVEAHRDRVAADRQEADARRALAPDRLFLDAAGWADVAAGRCRAFPALDDAAPVPRFCLDDKPGHLFAAFLATSIAAGRRIVLAGAREKDLAALAREAGRSTDAAPPRIAQWSEVAALPPGAIVLLKASVDHGYDDAAGAITLVGAADLLGHHVRASAYHAVRAPWHFGDGDFAFGDHVIHLDHGVGVLRELETVAEGVAQGRDALRLDYAKGASLLAPVEEMDRVWRYVGAEDALALDKLDTDAWQKRRAELAREIAATAAQLVALARRREQTTVPKVVPPRRDYEAFVAGFPYTPTPDQIHAVDDCLRDLAAGRPMDRLVVGDVGFGKTEVALRAAAAAVLAGWQVAVIAPTTVLVRQHLSIFEHRFADLGIAVGHLSRLVPTGEACEVREGLAAGRIRLVIGTHALLGHDVAFAKLGLLVIDEEQRFGTADKSRIRELGTGVHVLTLSATPIPRTLQSALVGLQDLSIIATPPARRRPIRTLVAPFDTATIRTALLRERARGGQSFVVVPRIEDLTPLATELEKLVPELAVKVGHGQMEAHAVDAAMTAFAAGEGDVLLATSIIESGLDVPRANTMIVCDAERFGLAQLHQLRGRVGRGRRQGVCYLMTAHDHPVSPATERRLSTLAHFDRLGSGMQISARDLDARGAGDLMGEDQAGHMRLIGLGLYQHLLQQAIRGARGEAGEDWAPAIHIEAAGKLTAAYIPEPEVRLNLYARLARVTDEHDAECLAQEIEDRFGPLPPEAADLLAVARLRSLCRSQGIIRIDAGPKAIAFTLRPGLDPETLHARTPKAQRPVVTVKDGRVILACEDGSAAPLQQMHAFLEGVACG